MSSLDELEIIPGQRKYMLGWDLETLKRNMDFAYTVEEYNDELVMIKSENFWFHLHSSKGLYSIYAMNNYKGKFQDIVSVGTVLSTLKGKLVYGIDEDFLQETMWWRFHVIGFPGMHLVPEKEWDDKLR